MAGLFVFGLTGGVASGKSTVADYFRNQGVIIIDADDLAREVVAPGSIGLREIEAAFGPDVVVAGALDRAALGKRVFADPQARQTLNQITHPKVAALLQARLRALEAQFAAAGVDPGPDASAAGPAPMPMPIVCYEVPLLFENQIERWLRPVVLVACPESQQIQRAMERNGWSEQHARQRVAAQMPLADKRARADFVIENDASRAQLQVRAAHVLQQLNAYRAGREPQPD